MENKVLTGLKWDFTPHVREVQGLSYLPYPVVRAAAKCDPEVVFTGQNLYESLFGGGVVWCKLDGRCIPLPILNGANRPIPEDSIDARDITDTIARCKVKTLAMTRGYGLALYAGDTSAIGFLRRLNVKPDSNLSKIEPSPRMKKNIPYLSWADALAAALITDENFSWSILRFGNECVPYVRAGTGYAVVVEVTYKENTHTEYAAIVGLVRRDDGKVLELPLTAPSCMDWHKAVMRALAKGISITSGYGLNIYARTDLDELEFRFLEKKRTMPDPKPEPVQQSAPNHDDTPHENYRQALEQAVPPEKRERVVMSAIARGMVPQGTCFEDLYLYPEIAHKILAAYERFPQNGEGAQ